MVSRRKKNWIGRGLYISTCRTCTRLDLPSRAISSASTTGHPKSLNILETVLLPVAIPPVKPTINIAIDGQMVPFRPADLSGRHLCHLRRHWDGVCLRESSNYQSAVCHQIYLWDIYRYIRYITYEVLWDTYLHHSYQLPWFLRKLISWNLPTLGPNSGW